MAMVSNSKAPATQQKVKSGSALEGAAIQDAPGTEFFIQNSSKQL
jgi:hypothetical protein